MVVGNINQLEVVFQSFHAWLGKGANENGDGIIEIRSKREGKMGIEMGWCRDHTDPVCLLASRCSHVMNVFRREREEREREEEAPAPANPYGLHSSPEKYPSSPPTPSYFLVSLCNTHGRFFSGPKTTISAPLSCSSWL